MNEHCCPGNAGLCNQEARLFLEEEGEKKKDDALPLYSPSTKRFIHCAEPSVSRTVEGDKETGLLIRQVTVHENPQLCFYYVLCISDVLYTVPLWAVSLRSHTETADLHHCLKCFVKICHLSN